MFYLRWKYILLEKIFNILFCITSEPLAYFSKWLFHTEALTKSCFKNALSVLQRYLQGIEAYMEGVGWSGTGAVWQRFCYLKKGSMDFMSQANAKQYISSWKNHTYIGYIFVYSIVLILRIFLTKSHFSYEIGIFEQCGTKRSEFEIMWFSPQLYTGFWRTEISLIDNF